MLNMQLDCFSTSASLSMNVAFISSWNIATLEEHHICMQMSVNIEHYKKIG